MAYPSLTALSTRQATPDDAASWMGIVAELEDLFGPMPDFRASVLRGAARGTALVVASGREVLGATLLSRDDRPHHINWLAVRSTERRQGVGTALLLGVLARWPTGGIEVVTFTANTPGGMPARWLYERFGCICSGPADPAPDGSPRDRFVLHRPVADEK